MKKTVCVLLPDGQVSRSRTSFGTLPHQQRISHERRAKLVVAARGDGRATNVQIDLIVTTVLGAEPRVGIFTGQKSQIMSTNQTLGVS